jgi:hypothetical protein
MSKVIVTEMVKDSQKDTIYMGSNLGKLKVYKIWWTHRDGVPGDCHIYPSNEVWVADGIREGFKVSRTEVIQSITERLAEEVLINTN